jgi:hypothetical protein
VSTRDGTIIGTKRERACVASDKLEQAARLLDEVARELPLILPVGHVAIHAARRAYTTGEQAHAVLIETIKRIPA